MAAGLWPQLKRNLLNGEAREDMESSSHTVDSWKAFLDVSERFTSSPDSQWFFRGQLDSSWPLSTTLERAADRFAVPPSELPYREGGLIRRFQRQLYHYAGDVPDRYDYVEWLAVMQHHGAPTRLLDWTRSIFAALFFALDGSSTEAAVWAINEDELSKAFKTERVPKDLHYLVEPGQNIETLEEFRNAFARTPPVPFVAPLNPYRLNPRLTIQQGVFLCPGDVTGSFEQNLEAVVTKNPSRDVLFKIKLSADKCFRREVVHKLHRMNMTAAALYPGLDGFARSHWHVMALPKRIHPPDPGYMKSNGAP